jgi:gamma-glutamyltranspeptidase
MVATSQPLAAQAGLAMLARGGNAVDAALATAFALTVVEPTGCGLGSDAFAIVWDGARLHGLNASGRSPAAWTPEHFAGHDKIPERGWGAVTVPGAVGGWVALWRRFGSLPLATLAAPAIGYAREGFPVSPSIAFRWGWEVGLLGGQPGFAEAFTIEGRAPRTGETFRIPALADSLEAIVASEGEAFYRGDLAARMVAHAAAHGGAMTREDLAAEQPDWVDTIAVDFAGARIHEIRAERAGDDRAPRARHRRACRPRPPWRRRHRDPSRRHRGDQARHGPTRRSTWRIPATFGSTSTPSCRRATSTHGPASSTHPVPAIPAMAPRGPAEPSTSRPATRRA